MRAILSHVRLKYYGIDNVSLQANPRFVVEQRQEREPIPRLELKYLRKPGSPENEREFGLVLHIAISEEDCAPVPVESVPYFIGMEILGIFEIATEADDKEVQILKLLNAPAILYGVARAEVCDLADRSRNGAFILPSINFVAMAKREAAEDDAEAEGEPRIS